MLPEGYAVVVSDLKKAYDVVVVRRKDAPDTSERWFGVASVESSGVREFSCQQAARISNVEVREVEYLPLSVSIMVVPSTSFGVKNPGKGKWMKRETPAKAAIKRRCEFDDESLVLPKGRGDYFVDPNFAIALKVEDKTVSLRRCGRSRSAPVFQSIPNN